MPYTTGYTIDSTDSNWVTTGSNVTLTADRLRAAINTLSADTGRERLNNVLSYFEEPSQEMTLVRHEPLYVEYEYNLDFTK